MHFGSSLENELERNADKTGGRENSYYSKEKMMRSCSDEWIRKKCA